MNSPVRVMWIINIIGNFNSSKMKSFLSHVGIEFQVQFQKLFLNIGDTFNWMFSRLWTSIFWFVTLIGNYFAPAWIPLVGMLFFVLADWKVGIDAAKKRKEEITEEGLRKTVTKLTSYMLFILSALVLEKNFLVPSGVDVSLISYASLVCALIEFRSIAKNAGTSTGSNLWEAIRGILPDPSKNKKNGE